jgi:hypothetical protein
MRATMSEVRTPGPERPRNRSAPLDHVAQRRGRGALRIFRLLRRHLRLAALVDQPREVAEPDVFPPHAQFQEHVEACDPRRPAAGGDDLDVLEPLARDPQRIGRRRAHDDGRPVLVVVEDGDVHPLPANSFNDETIGRLDVFEVDRAEGRLQRADDLGQLFGVGLVHLEVETVDIGEFLEEHRLALHHRLGGQRADIAEAQHGGAVGDHRDEVAARGIPGRIGRVGLDFKAGLGHARGIGARRSRPLASGFVARISSFPGFGCS